MLSLDSAAVDSDDAMIMMMVITLLFLLLLLQGKVPVNEFGTVNVFKPWMLPAGTVHLTGNSTPHRQQSISQVTVHLSGNSTPHR